MSYLKTYSVHSDYSLSPFFTPLVLAWEAKEAGKSFGLRLCPVLSSPFHVKFRAEAFLRSVLVPQPCRPGPSCCLSSFLGHHYGTLLRLSPHRSSFCAHTLTCAHVFPRIFIGTLLGMWLGIAFICLARQKIALFPVSGVTGVYEKPDRKGLFPLAAHTPLGR